MKAVFFIQKDKYGGAKNKLYGDELVSRGSITVRDNAAIGKKEEGYYVQIDGDKDALKKARELLKDAGHELKGKDAEEVSAAIEGQESSAAEGFGAIFG
ncbi:MAG: hypothetical protein JSV63_01955 [Candidatus Aenigmatarchaeota archaeon]|nr:MAG: hypothetical protein JSV63_01955 [Candidatus Aenigmarchaeota archaeon]